MIFPAPTKRTLKSLLPGTKDALYARGSIEDHPRSVKTTHLSIRISLVGSIELFRLDESLDDPRLDEALSPPRGVMWNENDIGVDGSKEIRGG